MEDIRNGNDTKKNGCDKVKGFAEYVKAQIPHVEWLWIDTCCIDQRSSQEVSEAVNSMFEWYRNAEVCLAYLVDVKVKDDLHAFGKSEWFKRGWTLQELLAPRTVMFLNKEWQLLGHKGTSLGKSGMTLRSGPLLEADIVERTGIPHVVIRDFERSNDLSIVERLNWMVGRETTYEEDMSYSLLGIFGVSMPVIYGEGGNWARKRLLATIRQEMDESKQPSGSFDHLGTRHNESQSRTSQKPEPKPIGKEVSMITESLRFANMEYRKFAISESHCQTFEWSFDEYNTPFGSWLKTGDGIF